MTFLIKNEKKIKSFDITPEKTYLNRRNLIKSMGILSASTPLSSVLADNHKINKTNLKFIKNSEFSTKEQVNSFEEITTYNNFYEFGLGKSDPYRYSGNFKPKPWAVSVTGEVDNTGTFSYEDISTIIDVPIGTVKSRINRARLQLQTELKDLR